MSSIPPMLLAIPALAAVILLIWLTQWIARRAARAGWLSLPPAANAASSQRLALVQALPLDGKRRLLLVRCDGAHVLLLTGAGQDVVVGWTPLEPPTGAILPGAILPGAILPGVP